MPKFLINQQVVVGDEIGTVQRGPTLDGGNPPLSEPREGCVWVFMPSKGYANCYAEHNVKPLIGAPDHDGIQALAKKIVASILDQGLANSTWHDNYPAQYIDLLQYREDIESDVEVVLRDENVK